MNFLKINKNILTIKNTQKRSFAYLTVKEILPLRDEYNKKLTELRKQWSADYKAEQVRLSEVKAAQVKKEILQKAIKLREKNKEKTKRMEAARQIQEKIRYNYQLHVAKMTLLEKQKDEIRKQRFQRLAEMHAAESKYWITAQNIDKLITRDLFLRPSTTGVISPISEHWRYHCPSLSPNRTVRALLETDSQSEADDPYDENFDADSDFDDEDDEDSEDDINLSELDNLDLDKIDNPELVDKIFGKEDLENPDLQISPDDIEELNEDDFDESLDINFEDFKIQRKFDIEDEFRDLIEDEEGLEQFDVDDDEIEYARQNSRLSTYDVEDEFLNDGPNDDYNEDDEDDINFDINTFNNSDVDENNIDDDLDLDNDGIEDDFDFGDDDEDDDESSYDDKLDPAYLQPIDNYEGSEQYITGEKEKIRNMLNAMIGEGSDRAKYDSLVREFVNLSETLNGPMINKGRVGIFAGEELPPINELSKKDLHSLFADPSDVVQSKRLEEELNQSSNKNKGKSKSKSVKTTEEEDSDVELIKKLNKKSQNESIEKNESSKYSTAEAVTVEELIEELDYVDENNVNELKKIYEKIQHRLKVKK